MNKTRRWKRRARRALVAKCVEWLTAHGHHAPNYAIKHGPWRVAKVLDEMAMDARERQWRALRSAR